MAGAAAVGGPDIHGRLAPAHSFRGQLAIGRGIAQDLVLYRVTPSGMVEVGPIGLPLIRAELIGWIASGK